jgi:hypothetical protein
LVAVAPSLPLSAETARLIRSPLLTVMVGTFSAALANQLVRQSNPDAATPLAISDRKPENLCIF